MGWDGSLCSDPFVIFRLKGDSIALTKLTEYCVLQCGILDFEFRRVMTISSFNPQPTHINNFCL